MSQVLRAFLHAARKFGLGGGKLTESVVAAQSDYSIRREAFYVRVGAAMVRALWVWWLW